MINLVFRKSVGERVNLNLGGYVDKYAGLPVNISGEIEFFDKYRKFDRVAVIAFGDNNRIIVTPQLHQVTTPGIFKSLGISLDETQIIVLKSRVHFRRGFYGGL